MRRRVFTTEYQAAVVRRWKVAGGFLAKAIILKGNWLSVDYYGEVMECLGPEKVLNLVKE